MSRDYRMIPFGPATAPALSGSPAPAAWMVDSVGRIQPAQMPTFHFARQCFAADEAAANAGNLCLSISVPMQMFWRRLYFYLVLDSFDDYTINTAINFKRDGNIVAVIPVDKDLYGQPGNAGLARQQGCPSFSVRRFNGVALPLQDNAEMPALANGWQVAFTQTDVASPANVWVYVVLASPWEVCVAADQITFDLPKFSLGGKTINPALVNAGLACYSQNLPL